MVEYKNLKISLFRVCFDDWKQGNGTVGWPLDIVDGGCFSACGAEAKENYPKKISLRRGAMDAPDERLKLLIE
jgi:hypothetical protein